MHREVRLLRQKGIDSLILAIELFNRPRDEGRTEAVLIHADHAFEMLLKAAIRHRGGRIRKLGESGTIGFKECVGKCLSDGTLKCLGEEQAVSLQVLNGWRDAAQHYLLDLPENELYIAAQAAVTLFDDLLSSVFGDHLRDFMPARVLPVSTQPPRDMDVMLADEFAFISQLIAPGSRRLSEAKARLRPISILDAASRGEDRQPTEGELRRRIQDLRNGASWQSLFPGAAALRLEFVDSAYGDGGGRTVPHRAGISIAGDLTESVVCVREAVRLATGQGAGVEVARREHTRLSMTTAHSL